MLWRKIHLNWRYGLGEFAIVVLGVLAALWVENWNSDRKDRVLEREYLASLLGDFEADRASLDNTIRRSEEIADAQLLVLAAAEQQSFDVSPVEFVNAVHESGLLVFATHSRRTINDLMSTGNLRIIESEGVRTELADYYGEIEDRAQWQLNWRDYQIYLGKMLPEIIRWQGRIALSFDPNMDGIPPWIPPEADISDQDAAVLERLIAHPGALPAIENMLRIESVNYQYNFSIKERLERLEETVRGYLSDLDET